MTNPFLENDRVPASPSSVSTDFMWSEKSSLVLTLSIPTEYAWSKAALWNKMEELFVFLF